METEQLEMLLNDPRRPNLEAMRFEAYHARHPQYYPALRQVVERFFKRHGFADIHHARAEVKGLLGRGPKRDFLPAYSRLIEAECPALRGQLATRLSRFGS